MPAFPPDWENLQTSLQSDVETAISTLLATVDALNAITALSNATINTNPAATIKDVVRELKTVTRQTIRLARLRVAAFDTGNIGT